MLLVTWKQNSRDHTRKDERQKREHFEIAGKHGGRLGVGEVLAGQRPLDDYLQGRKHVYYTPLCRTSRIPTNI